MNSEPLGYCSCDNEKCTMYAMRRSSQSKLKKKKINNSRRKSRTSRSKSRISYSSHVSRNSIKRGFALKK